MGTLDAHLVAIDAKSGRPLWNTQVADYKLGYSLTHAPLVVKDKVIVGVGGGELGIRGFIAAYDAKTGKELGVLHDSRRRASPATRRGRSVRPTRSVLRSRCVEARRRLGLGDRLVRSRSST